VEQNIMENNYPFRKTEQNIMENNYPFRKSGGQHYGK
jgi:hypothetical protein